VRLVRADGTARVGKLLVAAPPPPPSVQESLQKMQKSLDRLERLAPTTEETLREYRDLAKSIRETIPDLRETNKELQKLIKNANDMVPMARKALDEITVASRNWGQVGERVNVLLRTNEDQLNSIVKNLDKVMVSLVELLKQENLNDVATILRNLAESSRRFPALTRQSEDFFRDGRDTQSAFRETLRRSDDVLDQLRGAKPGQQGRGTLKEFEEGATRFNRTMADLHELLRASAQSDGTLRRFLTDPSLYNHLDDTALMLTRIIPRLDRVLHDFEVFADKLARHPEALGLGGVVRPFSGLKNPPSASYYPK
jgi:phospholipid/cholesterol/gamma-HCH transport system substrate-binding protein